MAWTVHEPEVGQIIYPYRNTQKPGVITKVYEPVSARPCLSPVTRVDVKFIDGTAVEKEPTGHFRDYRKHIEEMERTLTRHKERLKKAEALGRKPEIELTEEDLDAIEEEVDRLTSSSLGEEGEEPHSDSDHAMYLRQDYRVQVEQEFRERKKSGSDESS